MSNDPDAPDLVRIGELSERLGIPTWTLRRLADAGEIPFVRSAGGHRSFDTTAVRAALSRTEDGQFGAAPVEPSADPTWSASRSLQEPLEEHLVWRELTDAVAIDESTPAGMVLRDSLTEMLNNAIDHSGGATVTIDAWVTPDLMAFRVTDDGDGAFAHLRHGLGLADDFEAISSLSKGKQTTWRERHTGEGIFFTSKANDLFQLSSNGKRWTVDNIRTDQAVGVSSVQQGTVVYAQVDPQTSRSTRDVFEEFRRDFEFIRTRPSVKLFGLGMRFVSRSEARRLLDSMEDFTEIDVDFAGVQDVGQGFVDELLRVWPQEHPGTTINPVNMNDAVEFMVRRGLTHLRAATVYASGPRAGDGDSIRWSVTGGRRNISKARMPSTPMIVPRVSDTTVSTRCTAKNAVMPSFHERLSAQMFFRNVGQMIQLHTPNATRNQPTRFEMSTPAVSARPL